MMINNDKKDLLKEIYDLIKRKSKEMGKDFYEYVKEFQKSFDELGGWPGAFTYLMNAEEKICDTISFRECVEWVKANMKPEIYGGAIISRITNNSTLDLNAKKLTLKVCFMDKDGNLVPDNENHHLIIRCNSIDDELKNYFGEKDTLVLK